MGRLAEHPARLTVFAWLGGASARQVRGWRGDGCCPCRVACRAGGMPRAVGQEGGQGRCQYLRGHHTYRCASRRRVGVPRNPALAVGRISSVTRPAPSAPGGGRGFREPERFVWRVHQPWSNNTVCLRTARREGRGRGRAGRCCRNSAWKKLVHSSEREYMTWVQDHGGRFCGDAWLLEPRPTGALAARPVARVTVSSARTSPTGDLGRAPYRVA
jgi:hypothetical protein